MGVPDSIDSLGLPFFAFLICTRRAGKSSFTGHAPGALMMVTHSDYVTLFRNIHQ